MKDATEAAVSSRLPTFTVTLSRTISCTIEVQAADAEAAQSMVDRVDYPLPPECEWRRHKDWATVIYDAAGDEVARCES